jgi:hypothetical protein
MAPEALVGPVARDSDSRMQPTQKEFNEQSIHAHGELQSKVIEQFIRRSVLLVLLVLLIVVLPSSSFLEFLDGSLDGIGGKDRFCNRIGNVFACMCAAASCEKTAMTIRNKSASYQPALKIESCTFGRMASWLVLVSNVFNMARLSS